MRGRTWALAGGAAVVAGAAGFLAGVEVGRRSAAPAGFEVGGGAGPAGGRAPVRGPDLSRAGPLPEARVAHGLPPPTAPESRAVEPPAPPPPEAPRGVVLVQGAVRNEDGTPAVGARVAAFRTNSREHDRWLREGSLFEADDAWPRISGSATLLGTREADVQGRFAIEVPAWRPLWIAAGAAGSDRMPAWLRIEPFGDVHPPVTLTLAPRRVPLRIEGTVRSADGERLGGVRVGVWWSDPAILQMETRTDDRGAYRLESPKPVPWGARVVLSLSAPGFGRGEVQVRAGRDRSDRADAVMFPGITISGTVKLKDGGALPDNVSVAFGRVAPGEVRSRGQTSPDVPSVPVSPEGRFGLNLDSPGMLTMEAQAPGCRAVPLVVETGPLGSTLDVELTLERIAMASIAVFDADGRPPSCGGCGGSHFTAVLRAAGAPPDADGEEVQVEENLVKLPLDFDGERVLEVRPSDDQGDLWPARLLVAAGRMPAEIRLRRGVPLLDAAIRPAEDSPTYGLWLDGTWRTAAERGELLLQALPGSPTRVRVFRPETGTACEVELTLRLPGWRPWKRGPVTLGPGEALRDKEIVFTRD